MSGVMTRIRIVVAALILMTLAGPLRAQTETEASVFDLRRAGWVIVEKTARNEWQAGVPPYEELGRMVYVVTYVLEKDGQTMTCTLARDVMYDTMKQSCGPKPNGSKAE